MASNWIVTPSDGVINNNNGTFVFPENTGTSEIEYTVTYSSETYSCSTNVVVAVKPQSGCPDTLDVVQKTSSIENVAVTGATITDGVKFFTGHTSFISFKDFTNLSNVSDVAWGNDAGDGWKWLNITVPANSGESSRICNFTINMNKTDGTCNYQIKFTQAGESCKCSNLTVNGTIE